MAAEIKTDLKFAEQHYRVAELAKLWGIGRTTLRALVKDEPDVVKLKKGPKGTLTTYLIPASTASRIHTQLLKGA